MTDLETAIMIKNMARETVRRMTATVKNAALREVAVTYSDGTTITTSMAAHLSDADIKNYFRVGQEFNIGSGGKDKMVKVKSVKILNATVKNAALSVKRDFTWSRSFASGPASMREVKIKAGAPVEKRTETIL